MSPITNVRLARARERVAALKAQEVERGERERRLPEAICAACGGVVTAGEGAREGVNKWTPLESRQDWSMNDRERLKRNLLPLDEWRRRHDECATSPQIVAQIIGAQGLSPYVAGTALAALSEPLLASQRARKPMEAYLGHKDARPRAWAWVGEAERAALRRAVDRARATVEPRRCKSGACAWCGVAESIGWRNSPERWSDGTAAPLCSACASVWDGRGTPQDRDGLRSSALQALSGAASMTNADLGLRCYVDIANDDHRGTTERWAYAPEALDALTERARLTWPASLPPALRDEYMEKSARAKRADWEALAAERHAAERVRLQAEADAARAQGWPI